MKDHQKYDNGNTVDRTSETLRRNRRAILIGGTLAASGALMPGRAAASDRIRSIVFDDGNQYVSRVTGGREIGVGAHVLNSSWSFWSEKMFEISFYAENEHIGTKRTSITGRDSKIVGVKYRTTPVDRFTEIVFTALGPHDELRRVLEVIP